MATVTTAGEGFEIRNITLNSSTDTPIDFSQKIVSAVLHARTAIDIYIRQLNADNDYFTIPAGGSLTLDVMVKNSQKILCYARSSSGSVVLEVIGTY